MQKVIDSMNISVCSCEVTDSEVVKEQVSHNGVNKSHNQKSNTEHKRKPQTPQNLAAFGSSCGVFSRIVDVKHSFGKAGCRKERVTKVSADGVIDNALWSLKNHRSVRGREISPCQKSPQTSKQTKKSHIHQKENTNPRTS